MPMNGSGGVSKAVLVRAALGSDYVTGAGPVIWTYNQLLKRFQSHEHPNPAGPSGHSHINTHRKTRGVSGS